MTVLMCIVMALSPLIEVENRAMDIAYSYDSVTRCECIYYEDIVYLAMSTVPLRVSERESLILAVEEALDREGVVHRVMIDDGAYYLIKRTKQKQDYANCIKRLQIIYDRRN